MLIDHGSNATRGVRRKGFSHYLGAVVVTLLLSSCASHRTVHWEEDRQGAGARAKELTRFRTAEVELTGGEVFEVRNVEFQPDSLRWMRLGSSSVSTFPLGQVERVSVVLGRGTMKTAIAIGAAGLALGGASAISCKSGRNCPGSKIDFALSLGAIGAAVGAVLGSMVSDVVDFVR